VPQQINRKSGLTYWRSSFPRLLSSSLFLAVALGGLVIVNGGTFSQSPHGDPVTGVSRVPDYPRGSCAQCHMSHSSGTGNPYGLFRENSNELCMSASAGGCHADQPTGASSGYPAQESDRLPVGSADPGYFEFNSGGARIGGVNNLVSWPGRNVWQNGSFSPHSSSPNMPLRDVYGNGACDNCHDVHGGSSAHDLLDTTYVGISNSQIGNDALNYQLCLTCHSTYGPMGIPDSSKRISEYYNRAINPVSRAGHGVVVGGGYVPAGGRLPCYDCHNPHGSQGYGNGGPNKYLLSDQRPGWYRLDSIKTSVDQVHRFCFGCHKSSDGLYGGMVEGLILGPLPNDVPDHASTSTNHCYSCHGRDYSSPTSNNVHNPMVDVALKAVQ
jgi:hypothetical protein